MRSAKVYTESLSWTGDNIDIIGEGGVYTVMTESSRVCNYSNKQC